MIPSAMFGSFCQSLGASSKQIENQGVISASITSVASRSKNKQVTIVSRKTVPAQDASWNSRRWIGH